MNAKRRRIRFHFWLDINKEHEAEVADTIAQLKRERSFSAVLRDGILIVSELRRGKVDKLMELYPWIKDTIGKTETVSESVGGDRMLRLEAQIQQLERMLLNTNHTSSIVTPAPQKLISDPDFVIQKDTSQDAAKNLLGAMSGLM